MIGVYYFFISFISDATCIRMCVQIKSMANLIWMAVFWGMASVILLIYPPISEIFEMRTCMSFIATKSLFVIIFMMVIVFRKQEDNHTHKREVIKTIWRILKWSFVIFVLYMRIHMKLAKISINKWRWFMIGKSWVSSHDIVNVIEHLYRLILEQCLFRILLKRFVRSSSLPVRSKNKSGKEQRKYENNNKYMMKANK